MENRASFTSEQVIVSYPREILSRPLWKAILTFVTSCHFPKCGNAKFLLETFFVCFRIFEIELKPARFIDSSVSSRIFLCSKIYDARLTYIYNIQFFDDNIFRGIIFRKEFSLFSKMVQATHSPFSVSPSSLRRKMVPRNPALNCWCSVSRHIKIKIETVQ